MESWSLGGVGHQLLVGGAEAASCLARGKGRGFPPGARPCAKPRAPPTTGKERLHVEFLRSGEAGRGMGAADLPWVR